MDRDGKNFWRGFDTRDILLFQKMDSKYFKSFLSLYKKAEFADSKFFFGLVLEVVVDCCFG